MAALVQDNRAEMQHVPKGDLHNHITRGGNKRYIAEWCGSVIPQCPTFADLGEMNRWNAQHIKPLLPGRSGYEKRVEASFAQAQADGVSVLHMSVTIGEEEWFDNSIAALIQTVHGIHQRVAPDIHFVPELAFLTHTPIEETVDKLEQYLAHDYFRSLDIFGDEFAVPGFKRVFRMAQKKGLLLKAHVGEFGTADLVQRAVEELELELDQVQHGIATAHSPRIMHWLADHHIQLNVCPTSNVLLSRVADYSSHPIRKLYDYGVNVTVNSDDMIIFDQGVTDEFFNLYRAGLFQAEELNRIRENALTAANR